LEDQQIFQEVLFCLKYQKLFGEPNTQSGCRGFFEVSGGGEEEGEDGVLGLLFHFLSFACSVVKKRFSRSEE